LKEEGTLYLKRQKQEEGLKDPAPIASIPSISSPPLSTPSFVLAIIALLFAYNITINTVVVIIIIVNIITIILYVCMFTEIGKK
jgi:hypothetical protein